jgi:Zn-finger domain-containing protein
MQRSRHATIMHFCDADASCNEARHRAYVCGRVDEESHRRCELEMQVASLHTEKANFEVVRNLQDEYRKLVLVIDGVQVMVEEHRSYLSAHIGEVTTQLAQQQQASRVELNATIDSHRVLLQTLEEEQACYRGQLVTQLQLYKEEAARVAQELTRLEEESKASTTQLEEKLRTAEVASTSALEQLGANAQQTKSRLELRLDEVESQHMEHVAATSAEFLQVGQKVRLA